MASRRVRCIVLFLCFLSMDHNGWGGGVEGLSLGRNNLNGKVHLEEQNLNPSPFKNFLDQEKGPPGQALDGEVGDTTGNSNGSPEWETVIDPKLYIITEYDETSLVPSEATAKTNQVPQVPFESGFSRLRRNNNAGHSLSIVNPLDVLRQRLLLEIARRRNLKQNQHQIIANAEILKNIG